MFMDMYVYVYTRHVISDMIWIISLKRKFVVVQIWKNAYITTFDMFTGEINSITCASDWII